MFPCIGKENLGGMTMVINYVAIGKRITLARKRRKLSQSQLAEMAHISNSYISYLESGERNMSLEIFVEIANALNVSTDELLIDNIPNRIRTTSHEMLTLLSDCNEFEGRVLLAVMRGAKDAIREAVSQKRAEIQGKTQ